MSPQLDYNEMVASVKGGLADVGKNDIVSEVSAADMNFGIGVDKLATGLIAVPAATGFLFGGIVVQTLKDIPRATGVALHEDGDAVPVLKKGRIWVYSEQAHDPTDPVYLRHTVNAALNPGDFRIDADTAKADDVSAWARWVGVTTAAGLAELEINIP